MKFLATPLVATVMTDDLCGKGMPACCFVWASRLELNLVGLLHILFGYNRPISSAATATSTCRTLQVRPVYGPGVSPCGRGLGKGWNPPICFHGHPCGSKKTMQNLWVGTPPAIHLLIS